MLVMYGSMDFPAPRFSPRLRDLALRFSGIQLDRRSL